MKHPAALLATPLLLALVSQSGNSAPVSGEHDWLEVMRSRLELPFEQVEPAPLDNERLTRTLGERLGKRAPDAGDIRAARVTGGDAGWIALSLKLPDGVVGIAVEPGGLAAGVALWDAQDFDEDPDGAWSVFTEQLGPGRQAVRVGEDGVPSASEIADAVDGLRNGGGEDLEFLDALYSQRRLMRDNSFRFTRLGRLKDRGTLPSPEWIDAWADNYAALATISVPLATVLGEEFGARYDEISRDGEESLRAGAQALAAEDLEGFGAAAGGLYRQTCQACHKLETDVFEGTIYKSLLGGGLKELGVRGDLLQVGVDLWGVPGEPKRSQEVADAVAALLAAASLLQ